MAASSLQDKNEALRAKVVFGIWRNRFAESVRAWTLVSNELKPALLLKGPELEEAEMRLLTHSSQLSQAEKLFIYKSVTQRSLLHSREREISGRAWRRTLLWFGQFALGLVAVVVMLAVLVVNRPFDNKTSEARLAASPAATTHSAPASNAADSPQPTTPTMPTVATARQPASTPVWGDDDVDIPGRISRMAELSEQAADTGDGTLALLYAIEALPDSAVNEELQAPQGVLLNARSALYRLLATQATLQDWSRSAQAAQDMIFCADGSRAIAAREANAVRVWSVASGQPTATILGRPQRLQAAATDRDCGRIAWATGEHDVEIRDLATGKVAASLTGHEADVVATAFSPDGRSLLSAAQDRTARIWSVDTGRTLQILRGHDGSLTSATISPDGTRALTGSADHTARVWDVATGRSLLTLAGHAGGITTARFNADGTRILTVSTDGYARLWDAASGRPIKLDRPGTDPVLSAVFSADGARLATATQGKVANIIDARDGHFIASLPDHPAIVRDVAFDAAGRWIVTTTWAGSLHVWDASTGESLATLSRNDQHIELAALAADGSRVVALTSTGTALTWPLYPTLADARMAARRSVTRCLTPGERKMQGLPQQTPQWCADMGKPTALN